MISIVIPLYNKEAYIAKTLQSVLTQTYEVFEILVINDGSTDDSTLMVEKFNDERIDLISIENSGVSIARNTGIEKAKYPWIAFLDADDWWAPTFLEEIVNAIRNYSTSNIFAIGRSRVFKKTTERYSNKCLPKEGETSKVNYYEIISHSLPPINSSNVVIKKSVFDKNKFTPGMKKHEDHDLWIRLCVDNPVTFINKPLSFYLKDTTQSASSSPFIFNDFLTYLSNFKKVIHKITFKEKAHFLKYTNSFIIIKFFQNYEHYTHKERNELLSTSKLLLKSSRYIFLLGLHFFSFVKFYSIFKKIKGNG